VRPSDGASASSIEELRRRKCSTRCAEGCTRPPRAGPARSSPRWKVSGAQGTVEYVGLILLVSLLMVGMVAAMKGFNKPPL
jgi:hypothetical protein